MVATLLPLVTLLQGDRHPGQRAEVPGGDEENDGQCGEDVDKSAN